MSSTAGQTCRDGKIKLKVKKRRKSIACVPLKCIDNTFEQGSAHKKRSNPFSVSEEGGFSQVSKKYRPDGNDVFSVLESRANEEHLPVPSFSAYEFDTDTSAERNTSSEANATVITDNLPVDWSVKTKLRITTSSSLAWCSTLKSSQEATGVASFARCTKESPSDVRSQLHSILHSWVHPNIPWLHTFPLTSKKLNQPGIKSAVTNQVEVQLLWNAWCQSFRSVFNLTRSGFCPYFYMYSHNMVFLFLSPFLRQDDVSVIITPTTKGFRKMLENEGITFQLPYLKPFSRCQDDFFDKENETDFENDLIKSIPDDHREDEFLESIGLKKDQFPSLETHRKLEERVRLRAVDQRHQSTVIVPKSDSLAILNFFLNSNAMLAVSGNGQGIPPTIYSPNAFEGAALTQSKLSVRTIKQKTDGIIETVNSADVTGLLFPHHIYQLYTLFQQQNPTFSMSMVAHQPSSSLNASTNDDIFANESEKSAACSNLGLTDEELIHFRNHPTAKAAINSFEIDGTSIEYSDKDL